MSKTATITATGKAVAHPNGHGPALDPFGREWRLKQDLRQRDVTAWNRPFIEHVHRAALSDERQAALESAIVAGWIESPPCTYEDVTTPEGKTRRRYLFDGVEVDDLLPSEVAYYGMLCLGHFEDATRIPKGSSLP